MKQKISITIEEDLLKRLKSELKDGSFRNKSHIVEFALNKFFKEKDVRIW